MKKLSLFLLTFLILIFNSYGYKNISSCTIIDETFLDSDRLVLMNGSISNSGISNCVYISAEDFVFDCKNELIQGDLVATNGILVDRGNHDWSNVTLQNCRVSSFNNSNVRVEGDYNKLYNITTFNSLDEGIFFYYSDYNIVDNIVSYNNSGSGIYLQQVDFSNFSNFNSSFNKDGLHVSASSNLNFNNLIFNNNIESGLYHYSSTSNFNYTDVVAKNNGGTGINIAGGTTFVNYKNIIGKNFYAENNSYGIYIQFISSSFFSNLTSINNLDEGLYARSFIFLNFSNIYSSNNKNGIHLGNTGEDSIFDDITSINNSDHGVYSASYNLTFSNLDLINNNLSGFYLYGNAAELNKIKNMNSQNNSEYGLHLLYSDNNIISNSIIKNNVLGDLKFQNNPDHNIFYLNEFSNFSSIITLDVDNFFNYTLSGVGNIGNAWSDLICLNTTLISNYEFCTNPINYSLGSGVYDFATVTQILQVIPGDDVESDILILPFNSFISQFMVFILLSFYFFF